MHSPRVGICRESSGDPYDRSHARLTFRLVDCRSLDRTSNADRIAYRWHEDNVARLQSHVRRRITVQQELVKIQSRGNAAVALQLDITQRANFADASALVQSAAHRGKTAHHVRTGLLHVTEHKYANGSQLPHRYAYLRTDQHFPDALVEVLPKLRERNPRNGDGPDFGQVQDTVPRNFELVDAVDIAEQLHANRVPGS